MRPCPILHTHKKIQSTSIIQLNELHQLPQQREASGTQMPAMLLQKKYIIIELKCNFEVHSKYTQSA